MVKFNTGGKRPLDEVVKFVDGIGVSRTCPKCFHTLIYAEHPTRYRQKMKREDYRAALMSCEHCGTNLRVEDGMVTWEGEIIEALVAPEGVMLLSE